MAFEAGWIANENEKQIISEIRFKTNLDESFSGIEVWAIDRIRNIMLVSVCDNETDLTDQYLHGNILKIKASKSIWGNRIKNNLNIHWKIYSIEEYLVLEGTNICRSVIKDIVIDAFKTYGCIGVNAEQIKENIVEFNCEYEGYMTERKISDETVMVIDDLGERNMTVPIAVLVSGILSLVICFILDYGGYVEYGVTLIYGRWIFLALFLLYFIIYFLLKFFLRIYEFISELRE